MRAAGIGDLHLDGRLTKFIPDLNFVIMAEVRSVVAKAVAKGCQIVIFYGDIGDKPRLSDEAHQLLCELFLQFPQIKFLVLKGNHDVESESKTGLDFLRFLSRAKMLPNVQVALQPRVLFADTDYAINMLPWPHKETQRRMLNVLHIETAGSVMDSGRGVDSHAPTIDEKTFCVAGHLHTNHVAGSVHFAGTLYQTAFGEKEEKFWHLIDLEAKKVISIPHKPKYTLRNIVIKTQEDLKLIPGDPLILCKLFIASNVAVPAEAFDKYTNVVKHNNFQTKQELEALVMEDFVIDDVSGTVNFDIGVALSDWMEAEKIAEPLRKQVLKLNKKLITEGTL